jgi:hypothetical protein
MMLILLQYSLEGRVFVTSKIVFATITTAADMPAHCLVQAANAFLYRNLSDHQPFMLHDWPQNVLGSGAVVDSDLPGLR